MPPCPNLLPVRAPLPLPPCPSASLQRPQREAEQQRPELVGHLRRLPQHKRKVRVHAFAPLLPVQGRVLGDHERTGVE